MKNQDKLKTLKYSLNLKNQKLTYPIKNLYNVTNKFSKYIVICLFPFLLTSGFLPFILSIDFQNPQYLDQTFYLLFSSFLFFIIIILKTEDKKIKLTDISIIDESLCLFFTLGILTLGAGFILLLYVIKTSYFIFVVFTLILIVIFYNIKKCFKLIINFK